jgi:hypothetical protein
MLLTQLTNSLQVRIFKSSEMEQVKETPWQGCTKEKREGNRSRNLLPGVIPDKEDVIFMINIDQLPIRSVGVLKLPLNTKHACKIMPKIFITSVSCYIN